MPKKISLTFLTALLFCSVPVGTFAWIPNVGVSLEAGTTGVGFGVESRLNSMFRVRMGYDRMPRFEFPMQFTIEVGNDGDPGYDEDGKSRFDRMSAYLEEMTGFEIDQQIDMVGEPNFHNFRLLADIYPFVNKKWFFTAGFYAGPAVIGHAHNTTEDMTTLISVSMYNNIYDKIYDIEYNEDSQLDGVFMGIELPPYVNRRILDAGRMGMRVGERKDGTTYILEPDKDNMVKAEMKVNGFRPFLGAGYDGLISRHNDRLRFTAYGGMMFWGGTPKVYTHDGTEIVHGLDNVIGQVGRYVDMVKPFKVFPVINLSISYTFSRILR